MNKKPVIGILPNYDYDTNLYSINKNYIDACLDCGGVPIIISPSGSIDDILDICHGFIFSGGDDFCSQLFNEEPNPANGFVNPLRDKFEIELAKQCITHKKACLGICRGMQVLNIADGGDIYQDIYSDNTLNPIQHTQMAPKSYRSHTVISSSHSMINEIYGAKFLTNSFHHQAIKHVGQHFIPTAHALDGIIEAIEILDGSFIIGVQWHPEHLFKKNIESKKLFETMIQFLKHSV